MTTSTPIMAPTAVEDCRGVGSMDGITDGSNVGDKVMTGALEGNGRNEDRGTQPF